MYMKSTKAELAKMLISCNRALLVCGAKVYTKVYIADNKPVEDLGE